MSEELPPLSLPKLRPRVIPVLLLRGEKLCKTKRFSSPKYVGDPRVAVKLFNDKGADELILLDIGAREPGYDALEEIVSESFMPVAYGGGIRTIDQAVRLFELGIEKLVLNTAFYHNPRLSDQIASRFGVQSVVACINCRPNPLGGHVACSSNGNVRPVGAKTMAQRVAARGAGEIVLQSVNLEGTRSGYDIELIRSVSSAVTVPVVALGGGGSPDHFLAPIEAGADAVAAGTMFVFQGPHDAVLITYPSEDRLRSAFFGPC